MSHVSGAATDVAGVVGAAAVEVPAGPGELPDGAGVSPPPHAAILANAAIDAAAAQTRTRIAAPYKFAPRSHARLAAP
jgi:hypothetical protein